VSDIGSVFDEFGLPDIQVDDGGPGPAQDEMPSVDDVAARVFGDVQEQGPATANEDQNVAKPEANAEPKPEEFDFSKASESAFLGKDGSIDSQRVSDLFLSDSRSFLSVKADPIQIPEQEETKRQDPLDEYNKGVEAVVSGWQGIVSDLITNQGMTHEQAITAIGAHLNNLKSQYDYNTKMADELARVRDKFESEFESIAQQKLDARISQNYAELGATCNDMIPGMSGVEALDRFVLDKQYGGPWVEHAFNKDNPNFASKPEAEKAEIREKWFRSFQADKRQMALVAEAGKGRWLTQNLPKILVQAQRVGAGKVTNRSEAVSGGVSQLGGSGQQSGWSPVMSEFLGIDSVN